MGERITTLDGVDHPLPETALVIADVARPIAIAGVMDGQESGVTATTTSVVLECANFDPMVIRSGARALNLRTEASVRFEKGLPPALVDHVIGRAACLITEIAGGTASRPVVVGSAPSRPTAVTFDPRAAAEAIGVPIAPRESRRILVALGCGIAGSSSRWRVTPPWWRQGDLEAPHDLTEEVARIHGYHTLPSVLPAGPLPVSARPPEPAVTMFGWEDRCRTVLAGAGATEVMPYTLTSREIIERCGFSVDQCVVLENPLSEEFALLRPSLIPTLLPIIAQNQEHSPKGALFEIGNIFIPSSPSSSRAKRSGAERSPSPELPREESRLLVSTYGRMVSGGHVTHLKGIIEHLLDRLGIPGASFRRAESCILPSGVCLWHPGRTMDLIVDEVLIGTIGEVHPEIVARFAIDQRVAVAELDLAPLLARCRTVRSITALPTFPPIKRDLAFTVDRMTPYADVAAVLDACDSLLTAFELFDTFEGAGVAMGKKSIAFHCTWTASDRTLTTAEVDTLEQRLIVKLRERFGAEVRE
jgi:phenylalanyl-tRNA synthetase beta chain